jgi:Protein of unknown function (DUF1573)
MKLILSVLLVFTHFTQAAGLEFDQLEKLVTAAAEATSVTADFNFTNKGTKAVTISKSDPGCSCLKVQISDGKLKYEPGESGVVRTTFDMGNFSGDVDKVIALWLDDAPDNMPTMKLTVHVHIPVLVGIEPKTLKWSTDEKIGPKSIHIVMAEGRTIHITNITSSSNSFSQELKTIEDGKRYDLVMTPLDISTPGMAVIRIETDCPITKHRVQQAFAIVQTPPPSDPATKP